MSGWAGSCELIGKAVERDELGVASEKETRRRVPCNVFSMGDSAYYAACAAGIHPQAVLQIRACGYGGERLVAFGGAVLEVSRVDRSSPDFVRLTLVERVGDRGGKRH